MITVILLYARLSLVSQPKPLLFCVSLSYRRLALFGETKNPKESNFAERLIQTKILSLSVVVVANRGNKKKKVGGVTMVLPMVTSNLISTKALIFYSV